MHRCRVCGHEGEAEALVALEMMDGTREPHRYVRCAACTCLQIETVPADLARYYTGGYYSFHAHALPLWKRALVRLRDRHVALGDRGPLGAALAARWPNPEFAFLQPLRPLLNPATRILDVGCGAGNLLRRLRGAGLRQAVGADPFVAADVVEDGRVLVHKAGIEQVEGRFDIVTFHHSFEHVPDGLATLRAAAARLNPGGCCVLRIPVSEGEAWERYGAHWVQLDAPRHLFLHTRRSLLALAARAGLRCEAVHHDSTGFQFWGSEQYLRDIPLFDRRSHAVDPKASIFTAEQIAAWDAQARELNAQQRGDQAVFYLRHAA